jgi:hypothetical protein
MVTHHLKPGDPVIYRKRKHTARPGRRAQHVEPEPLGEYYTYEVDKFWVVADVDDGQHLVTVVTRRGKRHHVRLDDPRLRTPNLWERIRYHGRFPTAAPVLEPVS